MAATTGLLQRVLAGEVRTRSGTPYSRATVDNYKDTVRRHVLAHRPPHFRGRPFAEVRADEITTQTIRGVVHVLAVPSCGIVRLADTTLPALLRDLYRQELIPAIPAPPVLSAAPRGARST